MNDEFKRSKITKEDMATEVPSEQTSSPPPPPPTNPQMNPLDQVSRTQQAAIGAEQQPSFSGPIPPQLQKAIQERVASDRAASQNQVDSRNQPIQEPVYPSQSVYPQEPVQQSPPPQFQPRPTQPMQQQSDSSVRGLRRTGSQQLEDALSRITTTHHFEELILPSKGVSYGDQLPEGKIHLRIMTGEEESILATPKFVKNGTAMNMIFARCIKEDIDPAKLLTVDRTFLLIYLRGKSYGRNYEVEIKCPNCTNTFQETIDLNTDVKLTYCPDDFNANNLRDTLPDTGFIFNYRLSTGEDELALANHAREGRNSDIADDSLSYRTAQLITDIEGITDKSEIVTLIKRLPISDVAYLRNTVNDPPFKVDTNIGLGCPMCFHEFHIELPMEASFFFPRRRPTKTE